MDEKRTSQNEYNFIYNRLVEDESDVLGGVAYAVYKRQKIEYVERIQKNTDRLPNELELMFFHEHSNSGMQIESYKGQAMELVKSFLDTALSEEMKDLSDLYSDKSRQEVSKLKPRFWFGVAQSVVGSVAFVFAVGALVMFTWSLNQGPRQVIENVFNVTITSQVASES